LPLGWFGLWTSSSPTARSRGQCAATMNYPAAVYVSSSGGSDSHGRLVSSLPAAKHRWAVGTARGAWAAQSWARKGHFLDRMANDSRQRSQYGNCARYLAPGTRSPCTTRYGGVRPLMGPMWRAGLESRTAVRKHSHRQRDAHGVWPPSCHPVFRWPPAGREPVNFGGAWPIPNT